MKDKILFVGRFPPPIHGASMMNENYFNSQLIKNNFIIDRIIINNKEEPKDIGKFSFKKFFRIFKVFFQLKKKLKSFSPNLIYFEIAPIDFAFLRDSIYVLLCKFFGKKIIFQIHARGINKKTNNFLWRRYYKFIFKNSKMILLSWMLYPEVEKIIPKKKYFYIPKWNK